MQRWNIPAPGTKRKLPNGEFFPGPCEDECTHNDCKLDRMMAEADCPECNEGIGYDLDFVVVMHETGPAVPMHVKCYLKSIE